MKNEAILAPLGGVCVPFWRPLDFEGPIRSVFLYVFGATAKTRKQMYFLTTVPLKLENAKQRVTSKERMFNPLGVLASFENAKGECVTMSWTPFCRHLVDFGSHLGAHWILKGSPK